MTEEQRRALFALREALRLCDGAGVLVAACDTTIAWEHQQEITVGNQYFYTGRAFLDAEHIDAVLQEHPES